MKNRSWLFNKRVALARSALSSDAGLRLLSRAMPQKIPAIAVQCDRNQFLGQPNDYVTRALLRHGGWFQAETAHCLEFLRQRLPDQSRKVGLEMGGHIGTQTVQIAQSQLLDFHLSVEPQPSIFRLLKANIALNQNTETAKAVNYGIAREAGELLLLEEQDNSGGGSLLADAHGRSPRGQSVSVIPVSTLLAKNAVAPEEVAFLWLDAEGMEPQILDSCRDASVTPEVAVIEFSPSLYGPDATDAFISRLKEMFSQLRRITRSGLEPMKWEELSSVRRQADILLAR